MSSNKENLFSSLASAIDDAQLWQIDADAVAEGKSILIRLEFSQDLQKALIDVEKLCPIRKQADYIEHVSNLEKIIESAEAAGVDRVGLQQAKDLVARCQIEYWLSTSLSRLADVTQAAECNEHDILRLKACIQKAELFGASESFISEASLRLLRLETELEMSRALATYHKEKLPIENPPPDYWQPCDTGHIVETADFPFPPEGGEYVWEPSEAFTRVKTTLERLKKCLVGIENSKASENLVVDVKDKLLKSEKDLKLLEVKDAEDKRKAIEVAAKAAKKLKKSKKAAPAPAK
jgi:hypothetical protein